jgi:hypothetical protein
MIGCAGAPVPRDVVPPVDLRLTSLDCVSALKDSSESLRLWRGGGPAGAAWNIDGGDLVCSVDVAMSCSNAEVSVLFSAPPAAPVKGRFVEGTTRVQAIIPGAAWTSMPFDERAPFETVLIEAHASQLCPDSGEWRFATDSFVAGVARGE